MTFDVEAGIHQINQSRHRNDQLTVAQVALADRVATKFREEFGSTLDMETCGKAMVIAASAAAPLCREEIPGTAIANIIALAGEQLVREARHG